MHEDLLERLAGLRDSADSAAQKLAAAQPAAAAFTGTDRTRTVTATVTATVQVSGIEVRPAWRQQLGAEANTTLRQKLNDNTGYRDEHWTPATTA